MVQVDISELREHLEDYLERVRQGESLEVCDRGEPVARVEPSARSPLQIVRPASRPFSDLYHLQGVPPKTPLGAVTLLRESRDQR